MTILVVAIVCAALCALLILDARKEHAMSQIADLAAANTVKTKTLSDLIAAIKAKMLAPKPEDAATIATLTDQGAALDAAIAEATPLAAPDAPTA